MGKIMKYVNWDVVVYIDGSTDNIPMHIGIIMAQTKEQAEEKGRIILGIDGLKGTMKVSRRD